MKTLADPGVALALVARVQRLSSTQARAWGSMTPHQMVVHLADAGEALLAGRPFPKSSRPPSRVLKWVALYFPVRWPHGIKAGADPAAAVLEPETFGTDRERAITALTALASASTALLPQHPVFGPMTRRDWYRWVFLHADHHLRQFGL